MKIKQAAARLYAIHGFKGTTLKNIACEVGIKTPSIYNHFVNKKELFLEMYQELLQEHYEQLQMILQNAKGKTTGDQLYNVLYGIMSYHFHNNQKTKITTRLLLFPPSSLQKEISEYFLKIEQYERNILEEIFTKGILNGEIHKKPVENLVTHFLCIMDGLFLELHYYDKKQFLQRLEIVWAHYWEGITRTHDNLTS